MRRNRGRVPKRRSPRISAQEEWSAHRTKQTQASTCLREMKPRMGNHQCNRSRKRPRLLKPLEQVVPSSASASLSSPPKQGGKLCDREDIQAKGEVLGFSRDQLSSSPSVTWMPEKNVLELILDTLQRRDTYEIFAEPVNPNEVEDYYQIIEEPMDFGTMRAKLHEGMYQSLDQFEARTIHELALKVFHVLKINPENFESKFSETRHSSRRAQLASRDAVNASLKTNPENFESKFSETRRNCRRAQLASRDAANVKSMPNSSRGKSKQKSSQQNQGHSTVAKQVDSRNPREVLPLDGRRHISFDGDGRSAYGCSQSLNKESIGSTVYGNLVLLDHVNPQDIGYKENLVSFIKGLGPTAQMVAKRKLLGCQVPAASSSDLWSTGVHTAVTTPICQNSSHFPSHPIPPPLSSNNCHANKGGMLNGDKWNLNGAFGEKIKARNESQCSFGSDRTYQNQFVKPKSWSLPGFRGFNCSVDGFKKAAKKCTTVLLDQPEPHSQVDLLQEIHNSQCLAKESTSENNNRFTSFSKEKGRTQNSTLENPRADSESMSHLKSCKKLSILENLRGDAETMAAHGPAHILGHISKRVKVSKPDQIVPLSSQFVFDLQYLRTRLDQMKSSEIHEPSQVRGTKKPFPLKKGPTRELSFNL